MCETAGEIPPPPPHHHHHHHRRHHNHDPPLLDSRLDPFLGKRFHPFDLHPAAEQEHASAAAPHKLLKGAC
eukprot:766782-Hanusia_phi.AAC.4